MNVLVTGGTGVLGTAAIPPLMRDGYKIRLLSRHAERDVGHFPEGIEPMEADIGHSEEVERAMHRNQRRTTPTQCPLCRSSVSSVARIAFPASCLT